LIERGKSKGNLKSESIEVKMPDVPLDKHGNVIKNTRRSRKVPTWLKRSRRRKKNQDVAGAVAVDDEEQHFSPPPPSSASEEVSEDEEVPTHVGVHLPQLPSDSEDGGNDEGDAVSRFGL
jgi:hypothetical protein